MKKIYNPPNKARIQTASSTGKGKRNSKANAELISGGVSVSGESLPPKPGNKAGASTASLPSAPASISPKSILLPYQLAWVNDDARFKIGMWSRQTGKSFACAEEAVENCLKNPRTEWVVLSAGERQALEFMRKAREWSEAFKLVIEGYAEDRDSAEALLKSAEIQWPNKSRMLALPANPDTARGYSANLILDEFAFHENPDAIWRAIYPSISNPLKGQKKIRIVSTPNGKSNKFYDLWTKNEKYSHHLVTIYDAVKQGLTVDIEELKAGLDDPEGWAQEYECQFLDTAAVLLPYEVIAACESPEALETVNVTDFLAAKIPFYLGIDFARKKDLTVAWILVKVGDVLWTRGLVVLRNMPTDEQVKILKPLVTASLRTSLDWTGPGTGIGDYLVKEAGAYDPEHHKFGKLELCTFTNNLKVDIFPKLRMKFDEKLLRVPVSREIREDLHSVYRTSTPTGSVTYKAPHDASGHADRCTALALAVRAASAPAMSGVFRPFHSKLGRTLAARRERSLVG